MHESPGAHGDTAVSRPLPPSGPALLGPSVTPATLSDLWADLVWPKLLEAVRLALRPSRIGLGVAFVLGVAAIVSGAGLLDGAKNKNTVGSYLEMQLPDHLDGVWRAVSNQNPTTAARWIWRMFVDEPANLLTQSGRWAAVLALPLIFAWATIIGGAISRMAVCDHAMGLRITWPQGLGFALGRWRSLLLGAALPLLLVWVICLLMSIAGWVVFSTPWLNVLGGALWFLFLIGGVVVAVTLVAYLLGHPLLVPAVAAENADAIDAMQHAYAFVLARPLRLVIYAAVLLVQAALALLLVGTILELVAVVSQQSAGAFIKSADIRRMFEPGVWPANRTGLSTSEKAARWAIGFWNHLPRLVFLGFCVSLYWCSSTMLYLAMRKVVDGQDTHEIWTPGMIPGTMSAEAERPRIRTADAAVGGAPAGEGVVDNGPADET